MLTAPKSQIMYLKPVDLPLARMKSGESRLEVRTYNDVQILDHEHGGKGEKLNLDRE